jgi:SAM-dependent methyltransferase
LAVSEDGPTGTSEEQDPALREHAQMGTPMSRQVNLYDGHYGQLGADPQTDVRKETYGDDLGQASWITLDELRGWLDLFRLDASRRLCEVACGSGGVTRRIVRETGATCVGVDVNPHGIDAATVGAEREGLSSRVSFQVADASRPLPFPAASFDALLCNDSINHLPDRAAVLQDWHRILRPGGRILFTDPIVVTGQLSNEEIRIRSSIGFFLFTPIGCNERLIERSGFRLLEVRDATEAVASVSNRWRTARARRREELVALEGEEKFDGLQQFLTAVHTLAGERRLSRFMYLAEKPAKG